MATDRAGRKSDGTISPMACMCRPSWLRNGRIYSTAISAMNGVTICVIPIIGRVSSAIPDHLFWSVRQTLKSQMLYSIRARLAVQISRNHGSEAHLDRLLRFTDPINPNILTLGFARRFATYKRATLLFDDLDWLRRIMLDQDRPVMHYFCGQGTSCRCSGTGPDSPHQPDCPVAGI